MAYTIKHNTLTGAAANPNYLVDGPKWDADHTITGSVAASEITSGAALTKVDDTNIALTLGGTPTTALLAPVSVTVGWTGTLSIARGGTGASTALAAFDALKQAATESYTGVVELATNAETATGTDTVRATTPADVKYGVQNGTWFTQTGTGAVARTLISKLKDGSVTPEDFGAVGDGVTNDSTAFQSAITALIALGGGTLELSAKTYLLNTGLTVTGPGIYIRGAGSQSAGAATTLKFQPSASSAALLVRSAGASVWGGGISGIRFYSTDSTYDKIAINLEDSRGYVIDNVTIEGSIVDAGTGTQMWSGGSASTGILTEGREFLQSNNLCINADVPIQINGNPNLAGAAEITADLFSFHNTRLIAGSSFSAILISTGGVITNMSFTGYLWIGGGTDGISWTDSTADAYSSHLYIENFRTEQGQSLTSYSIRVEHSLRGLRGLTIVNAELDGNRRGILMSGVRAATLIAPKYVPIGATRALNLDSTVEGLRIIGGQWFSGTTAVLTGQNLHSSAPIQSGMSSAIVPDGYYSPDAIVPLTVALGGTGLASGTSGGVLYYSASGTLASSAALANSRLVVGGGAGVAPATLGSLGTTTTVLHGNAGGAPTFGAVVLTTDVSGTLPIANGGTGATTAQDAMAALKGVYIVGASAVASATHTGTTAETTIATVTIPANAMGANGRIEVEAVWGFSSGGAPGTRTVRHKFGGSGIHTQAAASTTQTYSVECGVANRNATNSQVARNTATAGGWGSTTSAITTLAIDTTVSVNFTFTCQLADAGDSAILHSYCVKLIVP